MIPSGRVPRVPVSLKPVGEGRATGVRTNVREQAIPAALDGGTGLGVPQPPPSSFESRPAGMRFHDYSHDQQALYWDENDGGRVMVGMHPGYPRGDHEAGAGLPQRPTFRTPPGSWAQEVTPLA